MAEPEMENAQPHPSFDSAQEKHGEVHVKVEESVIFDFILSAGLKNIFEFRKCGKEKLLAALNQEKKGQSVDLQFFSNMEKFRNNVYQAQGLLAELNVPLRTLSKTNQVSTMTGIKQHMGYVQARILFLSECTTNSFKVLAELRSIYATMANGSGGAIGKNHFEKHARRLLSIKHEISVWVYLVQVLSQINLSALSLTLMKKESPHLSHEDFETVGKTRGDQKVWYECKLMFLKSNEIIAMKYFQSAESLDKENILFGKPHYLVGNKHSISPITFYVDDVTTDQLQNRKHIPKVFENLFFAHGGQLPGNSKIPVANSKSFQGKNSQDNYNNSPVAPLNTSFAMGSSLGANKNTNYSMYDDAYNAVADEDVNDTNLHDVSVVALTDDEAVE